MNTLNQWEAEAKAYLKAYEGMSNYLPEERILTLIVITRKKDEAILAMLNRNSIFESEAKLAREALALTEQLK